MSTASAASQVVQIDAAGAVSHGPADLPAETLPDGWHWVEIPLD
ncbi:hypothetical protein [Frondihabitans sp. PhB188]|nr:hypothetical protein [Frondihabitans sp. PhB188]